jgi:hypothetical protein
MGQLFRILCISYRDGTAVPNSLYQSRAPLKATTTLPLSEFEISGYLRVWQKLLRSQGTEKREINNLE